MPGIRWGDSPITFTGMKEFLEAIAPLRIETQVRIVSTLLRGPDYPELVNEPAMQEWVTKHAGYIANKFRRHNS